MSEFPEKEEHYLLRVQDTEAAARLRSLLHQKTAPATPPLELKFDSTSSECRTSSCTHFHVYSVSESIDTEQYKSGILGLQADA